MIRRVTDDLYQIGECVAGSHGHKVVGVYVLTNEGRPILVDCGSQLHRSELMKQLDRVLERSTPEIVFLTHSELPHSGNLQAIAERWPNIRAIVSNIMLPYIELAPALPLDQITAANPGTMLEVAGRHLELVAALLRDQPGSQWIYDSKTKTLFTGDGFGYYHAADHCDLFNDELGSGIRPEQFRSYHRNAFRFLRWIVPERLNADLDKLFQVFDVRILAPIHGSAIRGNIPVHVKRAKQAIASICADFRAGAA